MAAVIQACLISRRQHLALDSISGNLNSGDMNVSQIIAAFGGYNEACELLGVKRSTLASVGSRRHPREALAAGG